MKFKWKGKRITIHIKPWWGWLTLSARRTVRRSLAPQGLVTDGEASWTEFGPNGRVERHIVSVKSNGKGPR